MAHPPSSKKGRQFLTEGEKSAILSLRKYPTNYAIASTSEAILRDCHACLRQARNDNGTDSAIVRRANRREIASALPRNDKRAPHP